MIKILFNIKHKKLIYWIMFFSYTLKLKCPFNKII